MIDYLISDPTKKFELILTYILKVMIFTIYRNFLEFFMNLFKFISIFEGFKLIKKWAKRGYISRGTHVDATWHARPHAEPRGPTRVPAWHGCDVYIYYIYYT